MKILSHLAVDEKFLGTKLLRLLQRKLVLKGKVASYSCFHKWKPSNHEELLAFLGLLTISMGLIRIFPTGRMGGSPPLPATNSPQQPKIRSFPSTWKNPPPSRHPPKKFNSRPH